MEEDKNIFNFTSNVEEFSVKKPKINTFMGVADIYKQKRQILREYFEKEGFYLNDGIKYGLDFLIYTEHPDKVHSKYGCAIDRGYTYRDFALFQRMCNNNNKIFLLARVEIKGEENNIQIIECERFDPKKYIN